MKQDILVHFLSSNDPQEMANDSLEALVGKVLAPLQIDHVKSLLVLEATPYHIDFKECLKRRKLYWVGAEGFG